MCSWQFALPAGAYCAWLTSGVRASGGTSTNSSCRRSLLRAQQLVLEGFFQYREHDWRGRRGTWRCAEQGGEAAIGGADHFGSELQNAAVFGVFLDDLHALAGLDQLPILRLCFREVLAQRIHAVFLAEHQLAHQ